MHHLLLNVSTTYLISKTSQLVISVSTTHKMMPLHKIQDTVPSKAHQQHARYNIPPFSLLKAFPNPVSVRSNSVHGESKTVHLTSRLPLPWFQACCKTLLLETRPAPADTRAPESHQYEAWACSVASLCADGACDCTTRTGDPVFRGLSRGRWFVETQPACFDGSMCSHWIWPVFSTTYN